MDRAIPTPNKLISKKMMDRNMQIHLAKLNSMKSNLSRDAPQQFGHLKCNKKKQQVYEDRLNLIEKDNKTLLNRLTAIMKANQNQTKNNFAKSLNRDLRKRELVKITMENQDLLKRLQDQKSMYNRNMWETDNKHHESYLRNICEYPVVLVNAGSPSSIDHRPQSIQVPRDMSAQLSAKKNTTNSLQSTVKYSESKSKSQQPLRKNKNEKLDPMDVSSTQKKLLYQTKKKIGFSNYLIHVYLHNNTFNIIASNNDRADLKTFTSTLKEADELITRFGESYEQLVDKVRFKGSNIIFENPSMSIDIHRNDGNFNPEDGIPETQDEHEQDLTFKSQPQQSSAVIEKRNFTENNALATKENKEKKANHSITSDSDSKKPSTNSKEAESSKIPILESKEEKHQQQTRDENIEQPRAIEAEIETAGEEFISKNQKEDSDLPSSSRKSGNRDEDLKDSSNLNKVNLHEQGGLTLEKKEHETENQQEIEASAEEKNKEDELEEPISENKKYQDTQEEEADDRQHNNVKTSKKINPKKDSYEEEMGQEEFEEEIIDEDEN